MSRQYERGDTTGVRIEVKSAATGCATADPAQFIWDKRLYRVHRILQRWERSAAWWRDVRHLPDGDRQVWRVEASAGRYDAEGVYELVFDPDAEQWYLVRTFD